MWTITWRRTSTAALGLLLAAAVPTGVTTGATMSSTAPGVTQHDGRVLAVWGWPGRLMT